MTKIRLTDCIGPAFFGLYHMVKKGEYTHYWLNGGRGSLKSSFISIMCVLNILWDPLCNVLVIRKVGVTLRGSVFEQIKWAIYKLGLEQHFHIPKEKLEITYLPTGQKIIFKGFDDSTKLKSIKLATGYFKVAWYEELEEFHGMEEIRKANQSLIRGEYDSYTFFYSYNPPRTKANWVNQESLVPVANRYVHTSCYLDAPHDWLGEEFFEEALALKESNLKAYEHEYLGKTVGYGTEVFDNIIIREITDAEIEAFENNHQGIDFGYSVDPASFVRMNYNAKYKRLYIYFEIYELKLLNRDLADRIKAAGYENDLSVADSAEPKSIDELQRHLIRCVGAQKGKDSINYGIKFLQDMEQIIIDPVRAPNTMREFTSYELARDKHGNPIKKYPDKDNHSIDAVRYALEMVNPAMQWGW